MKKFFKNATLLFLIVTAVISLVACGGGYSVNLGIGDGKKENDRVSVKFDIAETIYDGYVLNATFSAKSQADLNDTFIFAITTSDIFSSEYSETTLCSVNGEQLKDGKTLTVKIELNNLSGVLKGDEGKFSLVLHRDGAKGSDVTKFNSSDYNFKRNGDKFTIEK